MSNEQSHYRWQRYLCPVNESYSRTEDGFLIPPEPQQFWPQNQHLQTLDSLVDQPCIIILGEPGIGKSLMLKQEAQRLRQQLAPGDLLIEESFADYASRSDLATDLFADDQFTTWQIGIGKLYLFFDGLDEAHERLDALLAGLIKQLQKHPRERIYLRIACRATAWPSDKNSSLGSLWDLAELPIYKLTVLSRQDVSLAAQFHALDPDSFLRELVQQEVTPLAIIPLTLKLLLSQRKPDGSLPLGRRELFFQACEDLCEERNRHHEGEVYQRSTAQPQRFLIAARLAAVTLFAGANTITTQSNAYMPNSTELPIHTVVGFGETVNNQEYGVDERTIRETLNTGLFTSLVAGRYVWPHRTFQEYLAAFYLGHHDLSVAQFKSVFDAPNDPGGKFPPQLHDTIAWLCSFRSNVKQLVLARDPMLLLSTDVATLTEQDRSQLVSTLLDSVEKQHHFQSFGEYRLYRKLRHPHLAQQLQTYLSNPNLSVATHRLVIDIAEQCQLVELQQNFVDLALDPAVPPLLRCDAADAVVRIGDTTAKAQLKSLLHAQQGDFAEHLKGAALRALWPEGHISAQELFAAITSRGENYLIDSYHMFLTNDVTRHLQLRDLPTALDWVTCNVTSDPPDHELEPLMDQIMQQALEHLDQSEIQDAVTIAILTKFDHHRPLIEGDDNRATRSAKTCLTEQQRRFLTKCLLAKCIEHDKDELIFIWSRPQLIQHTDLPWLLYELYPELPESQQHLLAKIIHYIWWRNDPAQISLIYGAMQQHPILAQHLAKAFQAIALESDEAKELRQQYQIVREQEALEEQLRKDLSIPQIPERLTTIEQGDSQSWWRLNLDLLVTPYKPYRHYAHESEPDITALPGWQQAEEQTQSRILAAAQQFLTQGDPVLEEWFGKTDIRYRPAEATYRAFFLLYKEDQTKLEQLAPNVWAIWTPAILNAHTWVHPLHKNIDNDLLAKAAHNAPEQFRQSSVQLLELAPICWQLDRLAQRLKPFWQPLFTQALWHQLYSHSDELDYLCLCLPILLQHDEHTARKYCASLLAARNTAAEHDYEAALI